MILSCPQCTTRYLIDPRQLGEGGRTVRCGKCSNTWHQEPPPDMPRQIDPIPLSIEPRPIPKGSNLPAFPPRRQQRSGALGWAVLVLVVAAVVGGAVLARPRIEQLWPPSTKIYGLFARKPIAARDGLRIVNRAVNRVADKGVVALTIEGDITNISKESLEVPPLKATLKDARDREVQSWTFNAEKPTLAPNETTKYTSTIKNPSNEATGLDVGFAPPSKG